jgi:hypothetical protein
MNAAETESATLDAGPLRVRFARREDRFAHTIIWLEGATETALLISNEGSPQTEWPPSPPLQSLHIEDRPNGCRVALLVGMAGHSHWSMSVQAQPSSARLTFDVACRVHVQPIYLGTSYTACGIGSQEVNGRQDPARPKSARQPWELRAEGGDEFQTRLTMGPEFESIVIHPLEPTSPPTTVRWRYSVQVFSNST